MKRIALTALTLLAVVAIVGLVGCSSSTPAATPSSTSGSSSSAPAAAGATVNIANFAFSPAEITVKVGDTVTWTNNDSAPHTVTGTGWDAGNVAPGASVSHKFDTAGAFDYRCTIHPSMAPGKVTVQ